MTLTNNNYFRLAVPCGTDVSDKTDDRNVQDKEAIKHTIIGISLPGYKCPHIIHNVSL
jgi:hypothetical protein